ncbi:hypothetical protein GCM10009682_30010 [Luedemannella flava]|uniref:Lipoprotein n=1 Tax=Luedemannella flava TaxID=349316 RepID=A0ABP4Y9U9_9ACTN
MKNRLIAIAIMGGVLLAAAGCDKAGDTTTTTAPTTAAAAPTSAAAAPTGGGTASKADCDKAQAAVGTAITGLLTASAGATGKDPKEVEKVITAAATKFAADLQAASNGIEDPAVKKALTDWVNVVAKKAAQIKTIEDVEKLQALDSDPDVKAANDAMTKLCGA